MDTNKKLFILFVTTLTLFAAAIMINAAVNFRNYSYESAIDKAHMAAEIVRDGLTAHMINGMMDKREHFLDMMATGNGVKKLWIVRSENVIKQYGEGLKSERPRDEIDKEVLRSGKEIERFYEDLDTALLRVTIPYTASSFGKINCLQCHNAKEGEVLGAVSLEFDISDLREKGLWTLAKIAIITLIFIILSLIAVKYLVTPYIRFFKRLEQSLKRAKHGDFSLKVQTDINAKDIKAVAKRYNEVIDKFNKTLGRIEKKLAIFLKGSTGYCEDPLEKATHTIDMLSDIHRFKNTIELDTDVNQIYARLASVIERVISPQYLVIFDIDSEKNSRKVAFNSGNMVPCKDNSLEKADLCRAYRTKSTVFSDLYPQLCPAYSGKYRYYYCIPFEITPTSSIVIMMLSDDKDSISMYKKEETVLMYYLENSKPVIESKILMQKLKERSVRDGLTGLYNRKFLEEMIENINSQANRHKTRYVVMMLDIDRFKMINDTYGHDIGDNFIKLLVETINHEIRSSDIAARYGGEEFIVLLHEATAEGAVKVAEKIRYIFSKITVEAGEKRISSTVSIGISLYPKNSNNLREAVKFADIALYKAKRGGRNRVILFAEENLDSDSNSYLFEDSAPE
ncbi:MAG: GGDEF domain-containing protein [Hydrogenimonas sp.]|nr:GGDEF domain-containing protein [Hydrogenimonas sp.]